jgi:hypothetical protein
MTLILGTLLNSYVILTADGRCIKESSSGDETIIDRYQKIFPIPNLPIAIVHHGQNVIKGRDVKEIVSDFINRHFDGIRKNSIYDITKLLIEFVDADAKTTLETLAKKSVIGFWVAGFGYLSSRPELYETVWPDTIEPQSRQGIIMGGNGQQFIHEYANQALGNFKPQGIEKRNIRYAYRYIDKLYKTAEDEQLRHSAHIFGGHRHQLVISKSKREAKWEWTIPPLE